MAKWYLAMPTHTLTNRLAEAIQFAIVAARTKVQVVWFGTIGKLERDVSCWNQTCEPPPFRPESSAKCAGQRLTSPAGGRSCDIAA